jgi:hypothetical protein
MNYCLIDRDVRVSLHDQTGEGWNGDWDCDDPKDQLLLRFDVDVFANGDWVPVDNASYCTAIPASIDPIKANKAVEVIMMEVGDSVRGGVSIKKKCEFLSWMSEKDLS